MASRLDFSQIRSLYVGTSSSTQVDTNNLIVVGNVGIGTTSPAAKLDVSLGVNTDANQTISRFGANNASGQLKVLDVQYTGGATNLLTLRTNAVGTDPDIAFNVGATEIARFLGSGNVGIGTTSPLAILDVYQAGQPQLRVRGTTGANHLYQDSTTGTTINDGLFVGIGGDQTGYVYHYEAKPLVFATSNAERMRITSAGNVGIGTTNPTSKLHVAGVGAYNTGIIADGNTTNGVGLALNNANGHDWYLISTGSNNGGGANNLGFYDANAGTYHVYFSGNGNVGIGTTSPGEKLVVSDGGAAGFEWVPSSGRWYRYNRSTSAYGGIYSEASEFTWSPYGSEAMRINGSGNVGIGTTSPNRTLTVNGIVGVTNGTANTQQLVISTDANGAYLTSSYIGSSSYVPMIFETGGSERMRITTAGNVGIGTTSPATRLDLGSTQGGGIQFLYDSSQVYRNGIYNYWNSGTDTRMDFNIGRTANVAPVTVMSVGYAGNVGIGTTSPNARLTVVANDSSNPNVALRLSSTAYSGVSYPYTSIRFGSAYSSYPSWNLASIDAGYTGASWGGSLLFYTNNDSSETNLTERMRITAGGNVGIGTTAPLEKLHVAGNQILGDIGGSTIGYNSTIHTGAGNQTAGTIRAFYGFTNPSGYYVNVGDAWAWKIATVARAGNGGNYNSQLEILRTTRDGVTDATTMAFSRDGNVGIGTTNPLSKVQNQIEANGSALLLVNAAGGGGAYVDLDFNTYSPYQSGYANPGASIRVIDDGAYSGHITFRTKGAAIGAAQSERMRIEASTGNVGIGTTSPGEKLHVVGGIIRIDSNGGGFYQYNTSGVFRSAFYDDGTVTSIYGDGNGSTPAITINNNNVGIGTTSPTEKLHVDGNVIVTYNNSYQGINSVGNKAILARVSPTTGIINYAEYATAANLNGFVMGSDDARVKGNIATDSLEFITNTSTRMTILSNGDVGINNTNPSRKLDVTGEARVVSTSNLAMFIKTSSGFGAGISYEDSTTGGNDVVYAGAIGAAFFIATGAAERVRVLSGGNVGIATNNPLSRLHVVGDARIASGSLGVGVAPNATDGRVDASNDIVAYSTSDQRLKENVMPIENALEKVKTLTGVEFDWKEKTAHVHGYHGHDVGIIAQDVQAVLPEAVRTNESGYLSVRYEKMIALLIEANKELAARVEELEKKLK